MSKRSPSPMDIHVGKRIRIARLKLGWSQEKLGDALGVTFQQVQKYEKGTNRISGSRLSALTTLLQQPGVEAFFEGGPGYNGNAQTEETAAMDAMLLTGDGQQMVKLWQELTDPMRRSVLKLVESIVENRAAAA